MGMELPTEPTANVIDFPGATSLDIPPQTVLEGALEQDLGEVLVVGFKEDGALYLASTSGDLLHLLGMLDMARFTYLLNQEGL